MKKKYLFLIPLIGIIIFLVYNYNYNNSYSEFEPTIFENNTYRKVEEDSTFYTNLEVVLNYNHVNYKINKQGEVLVKRRLTKNKEILFNYTKKALDTAWINSHRILKMSY